MPLCGVFFNPLQRIRYREVIKKYPFNMYPNNLNFLEAYEMSNGEKEKAAATASYLSAVLSELSQKTKKFSNIRGIRVMRAGNDDSI
jgi:hypothetical protein